MNPVLSESFKRQVWECLTTELPMHVLEADDRCDALFWETALSEAEFHVPLVAKPMPRRPTNVLIQL